MEEAIQQLKNGGVVIIPTDTVYGIGCLASDEGAIKRIFEIKNRPLAKPINVLVAGIDQIRDIAEIEPKEEQIIREYMPGAVTIILKKKGVLPDVLTAGLETVGVRIPDDETTRKIIEETGPLAVTSANYADEDPAREVADLPESLVEKVDYILDEGRVQGGMPSTIVQVVGDEIKTLRVGPIEIK
ncbi:MAG: L-threonylcarbamoyladenylate synthase [Candidatus Saccharibacteria bacterium]|nr:L-threonylcarbamoyladenylate synthase [Candidatus Saccharibacteria bacterium]